MLDLTVRSDNFQPSVTVVAGERRGVVARETGKSAVFLLNPGDYSIRLTASDQKRGDFVMLPRVLPLTDLQPGVVKEQMRFMEQRDCSPCVHYYRIENLEGDFRVKVDKMKVFPWVMQLFDANWNQQDETRVLSSESGTLNLRGRTLGTYILRVATENRGAARYNVVVEK